MTYEELLEEITAYERRTCNSAQDDSTCVSLHPLAIALRAVVEYAKELSKIDYRGNPPVEHGIARKLCQIIEKELG